MALYEEWFEQNRGAGVLQLRGGELELALFVGRRPFVYDAADCEGSVGRFTALLAVPALPSSVRSVELNAQNGFENTTSLSQQIAPLLELLPPGCYRLALVETASCRLIDWDDYGIGNPGSAACYYPLGDNYERVKWLVCTQLGSVLQDERINFYLSEIERGAHPSLIVLGSKDHDAWFVLDGHHKMMASWCCGVRPRALLIEFQTLPPIAPEEASEILRDVESATRSYLKWKTRSWWEKLLSGS